MKYVLLTIAMGVLGVVGLVRAQHAPAPKKAPPAPPAVKTDPVEEYWACGFGTRRDHSGDHCHCPAMVAEVNEELSKACGDKYGTGADNKPYVDCMSKIPEYCDIVKNADLKHPVHSCTRSCNKNAICKCADGPACSLPPLPHVGPALPSVEDPEQK